MKYILSLCAVLMLSGGMMVADAKQAEAGSRRNAAIAGAIIGGALAGAAIANHRRHHHHDSYYDDDDYGRSHFVSARHCRRVTRCRWRRARRWWSGGVRHYRPAGEVCRRVRVCH